MSMKTTYHFECDLCGNETKEKQLVTPKGWAKLLIENAFVDRMFVEKFLCPTCISTVKKIK